MGTHMRTQTRECERSLLPIFLCYSRRCGFCLHNWSVTEPATNRSSPLPALPRCKFTQRHLPIKGSNKVLWYLRALWHGYRNQVSQHVCQLTQWPSVCLCVSLCVCVCVCVHRFATSTFRKFQVCITVLLTLVTMSSLELLSYNRKFVPFDQHLPISPTPQPPTTTNLPVSVIFICFRFHIQVKLYSTCLWFFSHSMMLLSFINGVTGISFYGWIIFHYVCTCMCVYA